MRVACPEPVEGPPRRTRARSSSACIGTLHARRSASSDYRFRRRAQRYQLKTPWKNGTTHVEFEPVEFIAKLAALVPPPRAHLTRFHGVCALNAKLRAQLTPSGRGKRPPADAESSEASTHHRTPIERPRDDPGSSPGQALGAAAQARLQHRREHMRPLRRHAADRGQHRRTHRHPRPLRKARRASESALPTRPTRTARCGRVTLRRPRRRRRN